jgi:hypothetical protein
MVTVHVVLGARRLGCTHTGGYNGTSTFRARAPAMHLHGHVHLHLMYAHMHICMRIVRGNVSSLVQTNIICLIKIFPELTNFIKFRYSVTVLQCPVYISRI